jgi:enoyl-CoA hydratase/carnithine racemase
MDAGTWVTPEQALEWGLATEIDKPAAEDEPTQSARKAVVDALVNPKRVPIAQVSFTQEQMVKIARRVRDELVTEFGFVAGELDQLAEPETEQPYARYARIFEKLSTM